MLTPTASLHTPTTEVQVTDFSWTQPAETLITLSRPVITLVLIGGRDSVEASYCGRRTDLLRKVGPVVFTPPDREIFGRSCAAGNIRLVSCYYDRGYSERIVGSLVDLSQSQLLSCLSLRSPLLPHLLGRLMRETLCPGFVSNMLVETLGQAVLVEATHALLTRDCGHDVRGRLTPRHFGIIDEYVSELKYATPSVAAVAKACGLSERYFAKLFRQQTQQSIGQYFKSVQVLKARTYLADSDLPLKEIASRLGFSAASNFSAAFRAATGVTPRQFRSAHRSDALECEADSVP